MNRTLFVLLILSSACSKPAADAAASGETSPVTPVQVAPVERTSIASVVNVEAVLFPLHQASIVPKITAPIQRFLVQRGDHVHAGGLLAVLENRDLATAAQENKALYEQAQATFKNTSAATMPDELTRSQNDVKSAEEALDAATKVYESRLHLFKEGALAQKLVEDAKVVKVQAQSTLDTAQQHLQSLQRVGQSSQLEAAKSQVAAAEARYRSAEAQVSYSRIQSPIGGIVSDRPLNVGEMASSGSSLLTIVDISRVVARANVPVDATTKMRVGQPGIISSGTIELSGKVVVVSPAVDPNTTTVQVWVEAANPGEKIKLGTSVRVKIQVADLTNAVVVPTSALLPAEGGGERVMIAGSDSLAHSQPVKTGIRNGDSVQITSGLKGGEQVIVAGGLGLDDGAKIEIATGKDKP